MRDDTSSQTSMPWSSHRRNDAALGMRSLGERQSEFATAILSPDLPVPPGLIGPDGETSARRFAVYRNNVIVGLIETLKAAFPVVRRLVGNEFFSAMARIYASLEPPGSPIMLDYGVGFADFIGAFEPAASLSYLRDVARLERAWVEAYHAAESAQLDLVAFARIDPTKVPRMRLTLHPSIRIVRSSFPAVSIWQANIDTDVPTAVEIDSGGQDALVSRPVAEVEVRVLPTGMAAFIHALAAGMPIIEATESAFEDSPGFDLNVALAGLLAAQAIVGWNLPEDSPHNRLEEST